jgi:hypothetical protein
MTTPCSALPATTYRHLLDGLRMTHNPKVAGSNPAPATNEHAGQRPFRRAGRASLLWSDLWVENPKVRPRRDSEEGRSCWRVGRRLGGDDARDGVEAPASLSDLIPQVGPVRARPGGLHQHGGLDQALQQLIGGVADLEGCRAA